MYCTSRVRIVYEIEKEEEEEVVVVEANFTGPWVLSVCQIFRKPMSLSLSLSAWKINVHTAHTVYTREGKNDREQGITRIWV